MLAILTTHPIQYQIPIWRMLAARGKTPLKVYFLSDQGLAARHDPGFGRAVAWDIDLLGGYEHEFAPVAKGRSQASFWWLRLREDLPRQLKGQGANVLWLQGWQVAAYWQAVWMAAAAGMKVWLRAETNTMSTGKGWTRPVKDRLLSALFSRVDTFLCVGDGNRQFYRDRGIEEGRLASAPYCVDNARFAEAASRRRPNRAALRAAWGVPPDAFCLLFVGKMIAKKRPLDLVAAARRASALGLGRPIHILFVGVGELFDALRASCSVAYDPSGAHFGERGDVKGPTASFLGFLNQTEIAQAYVAADCLALPSESSETWGLVVNEAMACGLPAIVSSACGCAQDLVAPYRPDLCFPLGEIGRFASAIAAASAYPPSTEQLATIIERYDVLRTVETVERLYAATSA